MVRLVVILFLFCACVSKKKVVELTRQQHEQIERAEERNESDVAVGTATELSGITAYDFSQLVGKWSLDYDGQMGDGFRFYLNQTEKGWEAGAEGKGSASANREEVKINSRLEMDWQTKFDSLTTITESKLREYESRIKSIEKDKSIDKKSTGLTAGGYILTTALCVVVILLFWLGWRLRKLSRSVNSFLNFKNLLKGDFL